MRKILAKTLYYGLEIANILNIGNYIKKEKIILYGGMGGKWYGDNSEHQYEYMLQKHPEIKQYWITKNKEIYQKLKTENKPVLMQQSIKGILTTMKAQIAVMTNSTMDIAINPLILPKNIELIDLRHGRSVKGVRFARKQHKISIIEEAMRYYEIKRITKMVSTSEFITEVQEIAMGVKKDKQEITGYPRNDALIEPTTKEKKIWETYEKQQLKIEDNEPKKTIILYAPSWRHGRNPTKFFPFKDKKITQLNEYLEKNDMLMLLRPHKNDLMKFQENTEELNKIVKHNQNIKLCTHKEINDINSILSFIDILISDYSAIYHDYLLLNRPVLFTPYDYDDFEKQNGTLYDYFKNICGPAIWTQEQLIKELENIKQHKDEYKEKREKLTKKIHKYTDPKNRERVEKMIINELK